MCLESNELLLGVLARNHTRNYMYIVRARMKVNTDARLFDDPIDTHAHTSLSNGRGKHEGSDRHNGYASKPYTKVQLATTATPSAEGANEENQHHERSLCDIDVIVLRRSRTHGFSFRGPRGACV